MTAAPIDMLADPLMFEVDPPESVLPEGVVHVGSVFGGPRHVADLSTPIYSSVAEAMPAAASQGVRP